MLRRGRHENLMRLVRESDQLLRSTIEGDVRAVAETVARVHDMSCAPTFYNNEQSLRYVVKMAYISSVDQYSIIEEMPSGHGCADIAFLPRRGSQLPPMIIELKWNKSAESAIAQIRDRNYPAVLQRMGQEIVLVGISYSERTKEHTYRIERWSNEVMQ